MQDSTFATAVLNTVTILGYLLAIGICCDIDSGFRAPYGISDAVLHRGSQSVFLLAGFLRFVSGNDYGLFNYNNSDNLYNSKSNNSIESPMHSFFLATGAKILQ